MSYKVLDDVDLPLGSGRRGKYPFPTMKIGQCFVIKDGESHKVASAASWYGTRHNMKFSVRRIDHGDDAGRSACFRIE